MNRQIKRLGGALLVLFALLFVQLNVVQVLRADTYNNNPANTRAVTRDFNEPRGQIVAADGVVLARSEPVDQGEFERQRLYPEGDLFGHITGHFSFSFGAEGVERSYNSELAGRSAATTVDGFVDLLLDDERTFDVHLTISKALQEIARDALGGQRGSVVALDPRDGSVLALWSEPAYDPNPLSVLDQDLAQSNRDALLDDPSQPLLARSFRETFFPGSTFKVVTAAAGLVEGSIDLDQPDYPPSREYLAPQTTRPIRNFEGGQCGGTLVEILVVSCNTAFAQMGVDIGAEALVGTAENFGFSTAAPLDLPSVAASDIGGADSFGDRIPVLAQTAIGQNAVRATPLQMALTAAAIANGGEIMVPHVMDEIRDDEGRVVRRFTPEVWRQAVPPDVASVVGSAMVEVVARGTASRLAVPGVATAGKTGTAQLGTDPPSSHAWIIGYAPADAPRVAVAVIVEGQPGASEQTGGRVAAPIARAVLEAALAQTDAG